MKTWIGTIERPDSDYSDAIRSHVSKNLGNVVIGIEAGNPISIGSNETKRTGERGEGMG